MFGEMLAQRRTQMQSPGLSPRVSDEVDTGSSQKMRPNKRLERRSDSIGSVCALAGCSSLRCGNVHAVNVDEAGSMEGDYNRQERRKIGRQLRPQTLQPAKRAM